MSDLENKSKSKKKKSVAKSKPAAKPEPTLVELKEDWAKERKSRIRAEKLRRYMAKRDQERK